MLYVSLGHLSPITWTAAPVLTRSVHGSVPWARSVRFRETQDDRAFAHLENGRAIEHERPIGRPRA